MSRTVRALAVLAALAGVVLGFLACGASPATAASSPVVVAGAAPGCGQGHPGDEGAAGPVVPPRPNGFAALLPALAGERAAGGDGCADAGVTDPAPGPEPPELVPPSPVELSILRV